MTARRFAASLLFLSVLAAAATSDAQRTLQRSFDPTFHIEPLVHRFKARRGAVVPFEFEISTGGREMEIELQPVSLRQEESGLILHDTQNPAREDIQLRTPRRFKLAPGETQAITGKVTVPIARSNYLSYGLLVRELTAEPEFDDADAEGTQIGVRFVTQYVLRVDIETGLADAGAMKDLQIEQAAVVAENGLPKMQTYLNNPTGYAFECFVTADLQRDEKRRATPTRLSMLSRSNITGPGKHLIRIMPHSRLRLEAPVAGTLPLGPQVLTVDLSSGRRRVRSVDFGLDLKIDQFPALASHRARIGGVSVSPSQLQLGAIRGVNRTAPLEFKNTSDQPVEVSLAPRDMQGETIDAVRYSPSSFTIKPGRSKKVRAMLRSADAVGGLTSAVTHVEVADANGQSREQQLPLAIWTAPPTEPRLDVSQITWKPSTEGSGFAVTVRNDAQEYVPLSATLAVSDKSGGTLHMQDGYGVWLAPGASTELVFRPEHALPSGDYALSLAIETREGAEPLVRKLKVALTSAEATADARPQASDAQAG